MLLVCSAHYKNLRKLSWSDVKVVWCSCLDFRFVWNFPEFHPGVPWKGLQNIDPENDPDVTPGSVPTGPTINTTIQDVNRYLLKSGGEGGPRLGGGSPGPEAGVADTLGGRPLQPSDAARGKVRWCSW